MNKDEEAKGEPHNIVRKTCAVLDSDLSFSDLSPVNFPPDPNDPTGILNASRLKRKKDVT